ncbi:MAG TPA: hypothetical protein VJN18_10845 [Polyangiaceae bacterium]|nr:hypothetical protein [Polyangiaceae bacterium]
MGHSLHFLSLACLVTLVACGGSQPAASTPSEPGAAPTGDAPAEGSADVWSDSMSDKQKAEFMKQKVVPAMSKTFQEFDAKKYAEFGCKNCHGPQFKPHPVDFLPELTMKDGKLTAADTKPDMVKFMSEKVSPQMAEIFGKKPFDPATGEGFGCKGCHNVN